MNIGWTLALINELDDAPFPATREELIDYAVRTPLSDEVIANLQALEDDDSETIYESKRDIWPEIDDYGDFFNEDEY